MEKKLNGTVVKYVASCGHSEIALIDLERINPVSLTLIPCEKCTHEQSIEFLKNLGAKEL